MWPHLTTLSLSYLSWPDWSFALASEASLGRREGQGEGEEGYSVPLQGEESAPPTPLH